MMNNYSVSIIQKADKLNVSPELLNLILETNIVPTQYRREGVFTTSFGLRQLETIITQIDGGVSLRDIVTDHKRHLARM
jgi:hypothetical protein